MVAAQPCLYQDAVDNYCAHIEEFTSFIPYTFTLHGLQVLPTQVNNLSEIETIGVPPALEGYNGCEAGIFTHLLHQPAEVVRASLAEVEEPFSVVPPPSAAPTEEGPSLSVASATIDSAASSIASSQDTSTEESIKLDYAYDSSAFANVPPEMTPQVVPSPSDVAVAINIATPAIPEAGLSGSIDTANAVLEC
ncbi:hypothetical protein C0989_005264 [Termitomyces sp. Mn162]|nr:hypothetical protein C0989_005264 [Termitomyces sp. Mn162]